MSLSPSVGFQQTTRQHLALTPQLRQSIQILQFNNLEVSAYIEDALLENPFLERVDEDSIPAVYESGVYGKETRNIGVDPAMLEALPAKQPDLHAHLSQQARLTFNKSEELRIATALIGLVDPTGWLHESAPELARVLGVSLAFLETIRSRMMRFDPVGVFATTLQECLSVQLEDQKQLTPAMALLLENLTLLAKHELKRLQKLCGVRMGELVAMIARLKTLDPKPGLRFEEELSRSVVPDVLMYPAPPEADGTPVWSLEINPATLPRLAVQQGFQASLRACIRPEDKVFLSEKMQAAKGLVKALDARTQTILRVSAEIIRRQDGFFQYGLSHLRPLTLKDIAAPLRLHEATVSRVTSNKSIATPRGVFDLKFFFTSMIAAENGISHAAETVKYRVGKLIAQEGPVESLSDDSLVALLQKEGINIARRTVAKYREALRIPSSAQRRRHKMANFIK